MHGQFGGVPIAGQLVQKKVEFVVSKADTSLNDTSLNKKDGNTFTAYIKVPLVSGNLQMLCHFTGESLGDELYEILEEVLSVDMNLFHIKMENKASYIYKYGTIGNYCW